MADVVLAVSPRGSDENTEKALEFFRELTRGFDVSHDKVHVGLVPKDCRDIPEIDLKTFTSRDEALDTIDRLTRQAQADTTDVLRYMRKASFSQRYGARSRAKKLALVIVDETPDNMAAARKEAERLQVKKGVELFVIGVGKHVKPGKLRRLATDPDDQHMFHVANYDDLYSIVPIVQQAVCPACESTTPTRQPTTPTRQPTTPTRQPTTDHSDVSTLASSRCYDLARVIRLSPGADLTPGGWEIALGRI
ncbi:hypothetical protein LSH36_186g01070 [Paralvinella palmiformis]|uniref:VWFA domain-containing protein n=1 Tax=Paralvinella palmiformis TaxID=53620 RepID=A0AAD9N7C2_9ANNE|nr:hypothetical protein LSH36_186g01070 [Paralvinella palmiformis]